MSLISNDVIKAHNQMRNRAARAAVVLVLFFAAFGCVSCGGSPSYNKKPTFSVEGKVYWKDKSTPAAHAQVVFRPENANDLDDWPKGFPTAKVAEDGSFKIGTYEVRDGAPAGKYAVLISWFPLNAKTSAEAEADKLNGRYNQVNKPRWTKTVNAGTNDSKDFVFMLK